MVAFSSRTHSLIAFAAELYPLEEIPPSRRRRRHTMRKSTSDVRFAGIDRASARGLRRFSTPGIGIFLGRRAAYADLWMDAVGKPLVRFSTGSTRRWFQLRRSGTLDWRAVTGEQWEEILGDRLLDWLVAEMDGEHD